MVVQHNLRAMNSNRMLGLTQSQQAKSSEKLSSGYKINRAADDAAGLSISEKMRKQIRGLTQASLNAQDGISAVQTAEGALHEVQDMLQRMNELAVKAANGTMSEDDRGYIQDEIDQLITEIDRVSETTKFNETYLLKGDKEEIDTPEVSGLIGGDDATIVEATNVDAKGNVYKNQFATDDTSLAAGTEDTATIKYKDANGYTRTKEVTFKVGNDANDTAKNFVEAINEDKDLSAIFKATLGEGGRFELESLATGEETDSTRNVLLSTGAITFDSDAGNTRQTSLVDPDGTLVDATKGSYAIEITEVAEAAAGDAFEFDMTSLVDGDSITIDGRTYTFDAGKDADSIANSFASIDDLQNLLGDGYEVSLQLVGTKIETSYDDQNKVTAVAKSDYVEATADTSEVLTDITQDNFSPVTQGERTPDTEETVTTYKGMSVRLNIVRKAEVEKEVNALNFSLQVGADTTEENKISLDIQSMSAKSLGINKVRVDGKDSKNADAAVDVIANAIQQVSTQRSALGAVQNRLEHTINNLDNVVENTTAAESQIRDTDMATEMVKFSNNNILAQAGQAMLAQSNQANQGVLALLQ